MLHRVSLLGLGVCVALAALAARPAAADLLAQPAAGERLGDGHIVVTATRCDRRFLHLIEERGPVLSSWSDIVTMRVTRHERSGRVERVELVPTRPLLPGRLYRLELSRTETGFGLERHIPLPFTWVAGPGAPAVRAADPGCCTTSLFARLAGFALAPFLASYLLTGVFLARRRRAVLRSLGF